MMFADATFESEPRGNATSGEALEAPTSSPLEVDTGGEVSYRATNVISDSEPILPRGALVCVLGSTRCVVFGHEVSEVNKPCQTFRE